MSETLIQENNKVLSLDDLERKMKFSGKVIKTTLAGAVVDIGAEMPGVVHISQLQKEPVNRVEDVVKPGQTVEVWVRRVVPKTKRLELTMIKPLDLEWREIKKDMTVKGTVTRIENFGIFVEIGAERPALVHISEIAHGYIKSANEVLKEGDEVEAKVINVDRRKKQIKLSIKALQPAPEEILKNTEKLNKEETQEAVPTAMEIALRQAMERSKENKGKTEAKHQKAISKSRTKDLEDILSRTLEQKVRTHS